LNLAPASYEARLAHACQLVRAATGSSSGRSKSAFDAESDQLLRSLLQEKPDEPRALLALGLLRRNVGVLAGARDSFGRLAKNPAFAATAWNELGWAEYLIGEFSFLHAFQCAESVRLEELGQRSLPTMERPGRPWRVFPWESSRKITTQLPAPM
jgi:hypothetical protein